MKQDAKLGPSKPTGLVATLYKLAEQMAERRAWMDAKEAAEFLGMSYDDFSRIAHLLPRSQLPTARGEGLRPRYRYYAPKLTEWLLNSG